MVEARTRYILLLLAAVAFILFVSSKSYGTHDDLRPIITQPETHITPQDPNIHVGSPAPPPPKTRDPLNPLSSLNGPPTKAFKENLRPELRYITSWISAGWTNDVMTYANLLYLAEITDRIPIIPMFLPSHIGGDQAHIRFGEVFDVPRLRKLLNRPILEWHEVKDYESPDAAYDPLGCWNGWEAVNPKEQKARHSFVPPTLKLDMSYTLLPSSIKLNNFDNDYHISFWSLARYAFNQSRTERLNQAYIDSGRTPPALDTPGNPYTRPSERLQHTLPPDDHLACFDYLYYVCATQIFEYDQDFAPAWRNIGQHMHWHPTLANLADQYIRHAFGMGLTAQDIAKDPTPPYIGIHMRHGDFKVYCADRPLSDCFPSIAGIRRRVREIQAELLERQGIRIPDTHVIMTSDERDEAWWNEVKAEGWKQLPHGDPSAIPASAAAVEKYGKWTPVFVDAVVQSLGHGFVGMVQSTMSIVAYRRVQSWQDGAIRMMKWGHPNSDDH